MPDIKGPETECRRYRQIPRIGPERRYDRKKSGDKRRNPHDHPEDLHSLHLIEQDHRGLAILAHGLAFPLALRERSTIDLSEVDPCSLATALWALSKEARVLIEHTNLVRQ